MVGNGRSEEIYSFLFVRGAGFGFGRLSSLTDKYVIDGVVNGVARLTLWCGEVLRLVQTGVVNNYVAYLGAGVVAAILLLLLV